jgi:hypothetical protein
LKEEALEVNINTIKIIYSQHSTEEFTVLFFYIQLTYVKTTIKYSTSIRKDVILLIKITFYLSAFYPGFLYIIQKILTAYERVNLYAISADSCSLKTTLCGLKCVEILSFVSTVEPLITDTLINEHLQ